MRRLIANFAAFSLMLHMLLGCCWHHAHAAEESHHEEAGHHNHDEHSPVDHDHQGDCEAGCVFVKSERPVGDFDLALLPLIDATLGSQSPLLATNDLHTVAALPDYGPPPHFLCAMLRC